MPGEQRVVSVDVDDVCFDFPAAYARWRAAQGRPTFDPDADHRYRFPELLGLTVAEYHRECEELLADASDVAPLPGCGEGMAALAAGGARLWLVSARTVDQQPATEAWATRWLPMVAGVVCVGRTGGGAHDTKAAVCARLGAGVHLDDNPAHLQPFVGSGVVPLAFGTYPWSEPGPWAHAPSWAEVPPLVEAVWACPGDNAGMPGRPSWRAAGLPALYE